MRITIEQAALKAAMSAAGSVVERRNTIPILSNVLIRVEGDVARFVATDLDMEAQVTARLSSSDGDAAVSVSAGLLSDIANNAPPGSEIELAWDPKGDPRMKVSFGRSRYQLPVLPAQDFPIFKPVEGKGFTMEAGALAGMIDQVAFAQSTEETRYYLNGTYLHVVSDGGRALLRLVATDGHRLALAQTDAPEGSQGIPGVILPRKLVGEVRRALQAAAGGDVHITASPQGVRIETAQVVMTSKVIDGSYPDYVRVVPRREEGRVVALDRELMLAAVKRVALVSVEKTRNVKLAFDQGAVTLSVRNMEAGQGSEEVECDLGFDPFEVGFNGRYLVDALSVLDSEVVELSSSDPTSPFRLELPATCPGAEDAVQVLMPLRV